MLFCYPKIIYAAEILRAISQLENMQSKTLDQETELFALKDMRRQCDLPENGPNGFETGVPILIRHDCFIDYLVDYVKGQKLEIIGGYIDKFYTIDREKVLKEYEDLYARVQFNTTEYRILVLRTRAYEALMLTAGSFEQRQLTETI